MSLQSFKEKIAPGNFVIFLGSVLRENTFLYAFREDKEPESIYSSRNGNHIASCSSKEFVQEGETREQALKRLAEEKRLSVRTIQGRLVSNACDTMYQFVRK